MVMLSAGSAAAQGYPARTVSGWTVAASQDGEGCFVTRTYARPGDTTVLLGLDRSGANHLSVLNANWSIAPWSPYPPLVRRKVSFSLFCGAIGIRSDGKQGFVTSFESKFPGYFAASRILHIWRGDVPVEQLDLEGSGAAVAELRKCVAGQRGTGAKPKGDAIPRDPFADRPDKKRK